MSARIKEHSKQISLFLSAMSKERERTLLSFSFLTRAALFSILCAQLLREYSMGCALKICPLCSFVQHRRGRSLPSISSVWAESSGLFTHIQIPSHSVGVYVCVHMTMYLRIEILFNSICCYHALLHRLGPVMNRLCTRSSLSLSYGGRCVNTLNGPAAAASHSAIDCSLSSFYASLVCFSYIIHTLLLFRSSIQT